MSANRLVECADGCGRAMSIPKDDPRDTSTMRTDYCVNGPIQPIALKWVDNLPEVSDEEWAVQQGWISRQALVVVTGQPRRAAA